MIHKTAALALALSAMALPALADCPGHKIRQDQSAQTQTEPPVPQPSTNS
jgi:hypothetical protein